MSPTAIYGAVGALQSAADGAGSFAKSAADANDPFARSTNRDMARIFLAQVRRCANQLEDALSDKPLAAPSLGNAQLLGQSRPITASRIEGLAA